MTQSSPLSETPLSETPPPEAVATPPPRGNILLVDDTPDNLRLLTTMLRQHGYKVRSAKSGPMALAGIKAAPPDLVLLDITMPQMSGYEVCEQLKADETTCGIPVIFISALYEVLDKVKAFAAGGVDYITKPFQLEEVLARIENQLTIQRLQQQLLDQNAQLQTTNTRLQDINDRLAAEIHERQKAEAALQEANQELLRIASLDGLTQVANRRRFDDYLDQMWCQSLREQSALTLILCDVDFFKRYNDTYGHQAGDDCLRQVAKAIAHAAQRPNDLAARYGGEEFAVILPQTDLNGGVHVAEMIQQQVNELRIPHQASEVRDTISLSIGVASLVPLPEQSPALLITTSDLCLYKAKEQGRNRIRANGV